MTVLSGPYAALAVLVVLGGAPKIVRPRATARALRSAGLPGRDGVVRGFGAVEAALGLTALVRGGPLPALLLSLSYAAFAAFVVLAMRRGGAVASCGCFGTPDVPPTWAHVVIDGAAALVALAMAAGPAPAPLWVLRDSPAGGLPALGLVVLAAWLGYLALTAPPLLSVPPSSRAGAA